MADPRKVEQLKADPMFMGLPPKRQARILMEMEGSAPSLFTPPPPSSGRTSAPGDDESSLLKDASNAAFTAMEDPENLPHLVGAAAAGLTGGASIPAQMAIGGGATFLSSIMSQKFVNPDKPVMDVLENAGRKGTEEMGGVLAGRGILEPAIKRLRRLFGAGEAVTPRGSVEGAASDIGLPVSDVEGGNPLRRPSEGVLANIYARRQEPRVLGNASREINKELDQIGAERVTDVPVGRAELTRDAKASVTRVARGNVQAEKEGILAQRRANSETRAAASNEQAARESQGRVTADIADAEATAAHRRKFDEAEASVRKVMGDEAPLPASEAGGKFQAGLREGKQKATKDIGGRFEEALKPLENEAVEAAELIAEVQRVADTGDPMAISAAKRLKELVGQYQGASPTQVGSSIVRAGDLRNLGQEFAAGKGMGRHLYKTTEDAIEKSLGKRPEFAAYAQVKRDYATEFQPTYGRGAVPGAIHTRMEQDQSGAVSNLFLDRKAKTNPSQARAIVKALSQGPDGGAAKKLIRPTLVGHLMEGGLKDFPKRVSSFSPEVLGMHLGAADADALLTLGERVKVLQATKLKLPSEQMSGITKFTLPKEVGKSVTRDAQTVGAEVDRLTSKRLHDLMTALREYEKPRTGAGPLSLPALRAAGAVAGGGTLGGPGGAAAGLIASELPGLLRTVVAYHPQGGIAKVNRALGAAMQGSVTPMIQLVAGLADSALVDEEKTR